MVGVVRWELAGMVWAGWDGAVGWAGGPRGLVGIGKGGMTGLGWLGWYGRWGRWRHQRYLTIWVLRALQNFTDMYSQQGRDTCRSKLKSKWLMLILGKSGMFCNLYF